ncbi:MAG: hypothetical protein V4608_01480 [Bacteroidota bacterium]
MNLFTSDIDWAPEEVIADTISLFDKYNVKCTFFCTHPSSVIDSIRSDKAFELGIHPNFLPVIDKQEGTVEEAIERVLEIVPDAKGVRSHSLVQSTPLLNSFKQYGLLYESNTILPYRNEIAPIKLWNGLVKVIHNFEDDIHFMYSNSFDEPIIDTTSSSLNIFCIHPIHVFLNTDCEATYNNARKHYQVPKELLKLRNNKVTGTRDLLIKLLEQHNSVFNSNSFTVFEYLKSNNFFN